MEALNRRYRVAVVGNEPAYLGFSLAGVTESHQPKDQAEADGLIAALMARDDVGIIAVTSSIVRGIKDRRLREAVAGSILPLVIELPEFGEKAAEDTLRMLI